MPQQNQVSEKGTGALPNFPTGGPMSPAKRRFIYLRDRSHPTPRQIRRMKHKTGTWLRRTKNARTWGKVWDESTKEFEHQPNTTP